MEAPPYVTNGTRSLAATHSIICMHITCFRTKFSTCVTHSPLFSNAACLFLQSILSNGGALFLPWPVLDYYCCFKFPFILQKKKKKRSIRINGVSRDDCKQSSSGTLHAPHFRIYLLTCSLYSRLYICSLTTHK